MAVGIPDERAVIVVVVLGPDLRLVEHFGTELHGGVEERPDHLPAVGLECDVTLPKALSGVRVQPQLRLRGPAVADHLSELHEAAPAQRREHCVIERGARLEIRHLDAEVVDHGPILPPRHPSESERRCPGP